MLRKSLLARCWRRKPTFSLTFDDGYVDNLQNAVAILERQDAPATVFIATSMLDQPSFWWDVLAELTFNSAVAGEQLRAAASRLDLLNGERALPSVDDDLDALHNELYAAVSGRSSKGRSIDASVVSRTCAQSLQVRRRCRRRRGHRRWRRRPTPRCPDGLAAEFYQVGVAPIRRFVFERPGEREVGPDTAYYFLRLRRVISTSR